MSFEEDLDRYGRLVEDRLGKHLSSSAVQGKSYHPLLGKLYDSIEEYAMRKGRRLAAASTLATYEGYAGSIDDRILAVACGIETYRQAILVHDDLVDADTVRRGGATLHKVMEEGYDERFGMGSSIYSGNILFSMALNAILSSGFPPRRLVKASSILLTEYQNVNESQVLDLVFEYRTPDMREWEVMASKRAATLFRATLGIGAALGGAGKRDLERLAGAGRHIGYAFDIQDDIIDTFASEEQYGRPPCTDILKGKKPLHIVLALGRDKLFSSALDDIRAGTRALDVEFIRNTIRNSGALDEAKRISKEHAAVGRRMISECGMSPGAKGVLLALIDYVMDSLDWYK